MTMKVIPFIMKYGMGSDSLSYLGFGTPILPGCPEWWCSGVVSSQDIEDAPGGDSTDEKVLNVQIAIANLPTK